MWRNASPDEYAAYDERKAKNETGLSGVLDGEYYTAAGSDLSGFVDGGEASSWAVGAIAWSAKKGLVNGYDTPSGKYLRPGEEVARERVAVVLMRAFEMGILE